MFSWLGKLSAETLLSCFLHKLITHYCFFSFSARPWGLDGRDVWVFGSDRDGGGDRRGSRHCCQLRLRKPLDFQPSSPHKDIRAINKVCRHFHDDYLQSCRQWYWWFVKKPVHLFFKCIFYAWLMIVNFVRNINNEPLTSYNFFDTL